MRGQGFRHDFAAGGRVTDAVRALDKKDRIYRIVQDSQEDCLLAQSCLSYRQDATIRLLKRAEFAMK